MHLISNCRFVDRDMVVRYHWGQGVGHLYSRDHSSSDPSVIWKNGKRTIDIELERDDGANLEDVGLELSAGSSQAMKGQDNSLLGQGEGEANDDDDDDDRSQEYCSDEDETGGIEPNEQEEEELLGFDEMYG
jgi:hypothetical protein